MNIRDIVENYLKTNGYTGLVNQEIPCGCVLGDLAICDGECMNLEECDAGYVHYCDDCPKEIQEECRVDDCPSVGGYCVGPEKELKPRKPDSLPEPWITDARLQDAIEFYDGDVKNEQKMTGVVKMISENHIVLCLAVEGRKHLTEVGVNNFIRIVYPEASVLAPDTKEKS
jgi:hypothetical protein